MSIPLAELPEDRSFHREWFKIVSPRRMVPIQVGLLSQDFTGIWTHFCNHANRTVPCVGEAHCDRCQVGLHRRWKGYIAAILSTTRQPVIVELTEGAARAIRNDPLYKSGLRGCILTLQRKKPHKTAPVFADLQGPIPGANVPPDFDVLPSLERLWQCKPADAGSDNDVSIN